MLAWRINISDVDHRVNSVLHLKRGTWALIDFATALLLVSIVILDIRKPRQ